MNDQDYIRKGIELADKRHLFQRLVVVDTETHGITATIPDDVRQMQTDALAAQLVRQVDALDNYGFVAWAGGDCDIREYFGTDNPLEAESILADADGPDRTMNTIKAIVDSKVLNISGQETGISQSNINK